MLYKEPTSREVQPTFISVADAAKILGPNHSPWAVYQLIKDEEIESVEHEGVQLVLHESVTAYAKRLRERTA